MHVVAWLGLVLVIIWAVGGVRLGLRVGVAWVDAGQFGTGDEPL